MCKRNGKFGQMCRKKNFPLYLTLHIYECKPKSKIMEGHNF